ncbi:hypothetical protein SpCBS45565_g00641 [Spizellomyces sp. 'palustris']|nr:hypothetical protein SpCBS45565_g00641 [Spizellomyces sp. 'palustris']
MKEKVKDMEREYDRLNIQLAKINASIRRIKLEKSFLWERSEGVNHIPGSTTAMEHGVSGFSVRTNGRKWLITTGFSLAKTIDDDIDMVQLPLAEAMPGFLMNGETAKRKIWLPQ